MHTTLIKKWDICAGNAILNSLGGQLTSLAGDQIDYEGKEGTEKNKGGVLATMHNHQVIQDSRYLYTYYVYQYYIARAVKEYLI